MPSKPATYGISSSSTITVKETLFVYIQPNASISAAVREVNSNPAGSGTGSKEEPARVQSPVPVQPIAPSSAKALVPNAVATAITAVGNPALNVPAPPGGASPPESTAQVSPEIKAAIEKPINIMTVTGLSFAHIWHPRQAPETCSYLGVKLHCTRGPHDPAKQADADALVIHYPAYSGKDPSSFRRRPDQKLVMVNLESYVRFPFPDHIRSKYDIVMSYDLKSTIPIPYILVYDIDVHKLFEPPLVPLNKQRNAMIFLNRNCQATNRREQIMRDFKNIQDRRPNGVKFEARGACMYNGPGPYKDVGDKIALFSEYKFCLVFENSNIDDYVSEKIWHAFEAGCIPIYWGPPNIEEYLPGPKSALLWDPRTSNAQAMMDLVEKIANDPVEHASYHAWRSLPLEQRPAGFRKLLELRGADHVPCHVGRGCAEGWYTAACTLCQHIAKSRVDALQKSKA